MSEARYNIRLRVQFSYFAEISAFATLRPYTYSPIMMPLGGFEAEAPNKFLDL